jgi:3-phenylpropionate/cinnamic acid dioxygenase small subunit
MTQVAPVNQTDAVAEFLRLNEIQKMLVEEAAVLDKPDYRTWLTFLTPDVRYWMPIRSTRAADDTESEFTKLGEPAFYDETFREIESRVVKLESGWSWSEDPPSRTRRFVTNLRILDVRSETEVTVETNIILYRARLDNAGDYWSARRVDDLRRVDHSWKIAGRSVFVDHTVLNTNNLGVFF